MPNSMSAIDLNLTLNIAREAAREGARVVQKSYGLSNDWKIKDEAKGIVTQTDLDAEQAILKILTTKSEFKVLSEESGVTGEGDGPVWVVDPLDGTTNFSRTLPLFAVSIGLMQGSESLLGVIVDPVQKREFYAIKGHGTYCNNEKVKRIPFNPEYIPTLFLNHGYAQKDRIKFRELAARLATDYNILKLGTTALELCYVADGSVDGFICSGDELWDFAAGIVITKEAGCLFTDWNGKPWDGKGDELLIARPEIHSQLVQQIRELHQ